MDRKEKRAERKSQKRRLRWLGEDSRGKEEIMAYWKPNVQIKKGMLVRCKAKFRPFAFTTTDEYQNDDLFKQQEDYWRDYWKDSVHPPGHTLKGSLKGRRTLVDVAYVSFTKDGIKPISKKIYIYPREQLSPLSQTKIERLYALLEQGNGNIKVSPIEEAIH